VTGILVSDVPAQIHSGDTLTLNVAVTLNGLNPQDIAVECLFGQDTPSGDWITVERFSTTVTTTGTEPTAPTGTQIYSFILNIQLAGLQKFRFRLVPNHSAQLHPYELGLMKWL
jgi:starch phosphorylase